MMVVSIVSLTLLPASPQRTRGGCGLLGSGSGQFFVPYSGDDDGASTSSVLSGSRSGSPRSSEQDTGSGSAAGPGQGFSSFA